MAEGAKVNRKQSLTMSVEEEISPTLGRPMHPLMDDCRAEWERETPAIVHVGAASAAPDLKSDPPIRNLLRSKNGLDNGGHFSLTLGGRALGPPVRQRGPNVLLDGTLPPPRLKSAPLHRPLLRGTSETAATLPHCYIA